MSEIEVLKRRLAREIAARKQAEQILEQKALELYETNEKLKGLNQSLEETVEHRTEELTRTQRQFQSLVESAGDIIYNANQHGMFTYVNPITEKILGYKSEQLVGKHFTELVQDEYQEQVAHFYADQIKQRAVTNYFEFPVTTAQGDSIWLGQRVEVEYQNDVAVKFTAVARNIQDLVEARNALEASEEKYRGIIEGMELGLLEVDRQGVIIRAYDLFCQMMGYSEEELIGNDPAELFLHPDDLELIKGQNQNRTKGQTGVYEMRLRKKDGNYIWVVISGAPFFNVKGEMIGSVGIHLDITGQKELQKELEQAKETAEHAQKAEKNFLAKMSHEIRTPLNAVIGMSNLLDITPLAPQQKEYVQDIRYASEVLLGLISEVLDLSKIEAGELTVSETEIDLRQSLVMLVRTLEYRARDRGNELIYHFGDGVPQTILSDQNIINQILLNLIGNAIKFTEKGTISISITSLEAENDLVTLEVSVNDTGIGIAQNKLADVFEKYKQERNETAAIYGGTGLGLYICKELVELLSGNISIDSTVGEGTSVVFTIKVTKVSQTSIVDGFKSQAINESLNGATGKRILVAEDSFLNQKYIGNLLRQWQVDFDMAIDGEEAVQLSKQNEYALILMDMQMPKLDGYGATKAVLSDPQNPNSKVPIVALTASALLEEKRKALSAGVVQHISKPFTPHHLLHVLQQYLGVTKNNTSVNAKASSFDELKTAKSIDKKALKALYSDDLEHCAHVTSIYLSTIDEELDKLIETLKKEDIKPLAQWLHRIKPTFTMIGLPVFTARINEIEKDLRDGILSKGLILCLEKLIEDITLSKHDIEELLSTLQLNLNP